MVDLVLVQADSLDQVDLDLVRRGQAANQVVAADAELLRDRDQRRDVVAGVGVLGGQKGVVEIQFAHRDAVGPGRPLGRVAAVDTEHRRARRRRSRMRHSLVPGRSDRPAQHRCGADRRVVDDAVDHHRLGLRCHRNRVGGDLRDLVGQVLGDREVVGAAVGPDRMDQHNSHTMQACRYKGKSLYMRNFASLVTAILRTLRNATRSSSLDRGEDVFRRTAAAVTRGARAHPGRAGPRAGPVHQLRQPAGERPAAHHGAGAARPHRAVRPAVALLLLRFRRPAGGRPVRCVHRRRDR